MEVRKAPQLTTRSSRHFQRKQDDSAFIRGLSSKQLRVRQNYIVNRDNAYTIAQGQFEQISTKPDFLRFISLKKQVQPRIDQIAKEIVKHHEQKPRNPQFKNRLRQRILFQRMKRPPYNSPVKKTIRIKENDTTQSSDYDKVEKKQQRKHVSNYGTVQDEQDNAMMIKQVVTRMEESKGTKTTNKNPYTEGVYYVAQAVRDYKIKDSLIRDHIFNSIFFLQLMAQYDNTPDYAQDKPIYMPQNPKFKNKITVVLDLDETLVHCFEQLEQKHEVQIPVTFPGGHSMLAPVNIRPHTVEVLQDLASQFELIVFTASHEAYANAVINYLDPKKEMIQHRLYRRHCDYIDQGYHVKDLRILGRDLSKTVIVDNAAYSYAFQVDNGIPITSYYEGQIDYELPALRDYLFSLRGCKDVRKVNRETFKQKEFIKYTTVEEVVEELYMGK